MGLGSACVALFISFLGIGLIIPSSLSIALKAYQASVGTAGSIFGGFYYIVIAALTWLMSILHDGTQLPLPLYMATLGAALVIGSVMVRHPVEQ